MSRYPPIRGAPEVWAQAVRAIPEFGAFRHGWQTAGRSALRKIDIAVLIAYAVPVLAAALWVILLILV